MHKRSIRKPPYTHREIAKAMIDANRTIRKMEGKIEIIWMPDWLKIEIYNLFMLALPHIITMLIWLAIFTALYWW